MPLKCIKSLYSIFFLLSLVITFGCKSKLIEITEEYYPDGSPEIVRAYREINGRKELVLETYYYPNHNKKIEGEYKNGKKHGKWTAWFENGNIQSEGFFKEGLNHGIRKVYYENGNKYYEGMYKNGKSVGEWTFYDINGNVEKKVNFDITK